MGVKYIAVTLLGSYERKEGLSKSMTRPKKNLHTTKMSKGTIQKLHGKRMNNRNNKN
jgi:hypothetical protein